jgi:hypothetical protein
MINLDKYSYHEAMDRSAVACDHFYDYVACHPVVQSNQELKEAAEKIVALMNELSGLCARYAEGMEQSAKEAEQPSPNNKLICLHCRYEQLTCFRCGSRNTMMRVDQSPKTDNLTC